MGSEDEIKKPTRVSSVRRAQGTKTRKQVYLLLEDRGLLMLWVLQLLYRGPIDATRRRKKAEKIAQQRRVTSRTKNSIPGNKTNLPKGLPKKTQKRRNLQDVAMAAVTIQKAFRRYKIK